MAACSKYKRRLKTALEYRGLTYPTEIINVMGKRGTSDRELDRIILSICTILEPPLCQKSHCPHHTTFSFCNCSKNLVPGKCKLNLDYLKGVKERREAIKSPIIKEMIEMYKIKQENVEDLFINLERNAGGISRVKAKWEAYKLFHTV